MKEIHLALLGFGTVGHGIAETLKTNAMLIKEGLGCTIDIRHVLVRNKNKYDTDVLLQEANVTESFKEILDDEDVNIVIEVMGGISPAKEYIIQALNKGKSVVSANKDLIAMHGPEIIRTAMKNRVNFRCEASVGGGIPILMPLHQSLASNEIATIMGIVNGTTNYILSSMSDLGISYDESLRAAQEAGFAEADPTSDVCGYDAGRKLAILASIGFRANVTFDDVLTEGIDKISQEDILYGKEMGYTVKLLAVAQREKQGIALNVYPAFLPVSHPLAAVSGSYNAIYVTGNIVGDVMFYGQGAGALPTASAVVGDVISTSKDILNESTGKGMILSDTRRISLFSPLELQNSYYFRIRVDDVTGVLSRIATAFAKYDISIQEVVQKRRMKNSAELMLITEETKRKNILHVKDELQNLDCVQDVANVLRVL